MTQYYDSVMQESGLKTSQFSLLAVVAGTGPIAMGQLAERQVMDRTTLTRNLRPLVDRGLLRVRPGEDRRARVISLTAAGRKAFMGAVPLWQEAQAGMVRRLGVSEWRGLLGHLGAVTEAARR